MAAALSTTGIAPARRQRLALWRAVEAQHKVSTLQLVDSLDEQRQLEELLEASKPPLPPACRGLHYLLATPFRYPPSGYGSRFRSPADPGVWYGAEAVATACAELGYWRCRFVADSEGLKTLQAVAHTVFRAEAFGVARDLRRPPWAAQATVWMHPDAYGPCQEQAREARDSGVELLRYASVRHPGHGGCAAVLGCAAFAGGTGVGEQQTWFLTATTTGAIWLRANGSSGAVEALEFGFDTGRAATGNAADQRD